MSTTPKSAPNEVTTLSWWGNLLVSMTPRATCMPTGVLYSWQGHSCWKDQRVETTQRVTSWSSRLGAGGGRRNTNRGCNDALWTKPAGHLKANRPKHQLLECEDHGWGNKGRASTHSYGDERVWDSSAKEKWGQARTQSYIVLRREGVNDCFTELGWTPEGWTARGRPQLLGEGLRRKSEKKWSGREGK